MTLARRTLTTRQKLEVMTRYARCPRCGEKFGAIDEIDWDHIGQLELTNDNSLENFRPLHRSDCHKRKTAEDARDRGKMRRNAKDDDEFRRRMLAKVSSDDSIDRLRRIADGDDRGRYPTTEEKRVRKAGRKPSRGFEQKRRKA